MTSSPPPTEAATGTPNPSPPRIAWYRRLPSTRRFLFWNLLWWTFAASALVGGILYTEHVVRPVAEGGGHNFAPTAIFAKEAAGQRVFGQHDRMNILVLGIDYNHDSKGIIYTAGARSDTMMVLSLSRDAKFLNVVSIPRDTKVFLGEDYGYDKINSAYSYGGVDHAKRVVSEFLGIPIHHHLVVKVSGAKALIDVIGGLPIDVEKDMDYDDNWGKLHIHLKKGPQVLDGEQAVGYARFRMDEEGDRGRIRRQQQVIRALGAKLKEPALIARFPEIAQAVKKTLDTDLKPLEMIDLASLYGSFDFRNMRSGAVVGDDAIDAQGVSYIEPYAPENERMVRRLLRSLDWVTKSDLRIRILYKNAAPEIADRLAQRLAEAGFDGVQVEALPSEDRLDTRTTYLIWYNKVTRLEGILKTITGGLAERSGHQPVGRDDDLAIVVGDQETGEWAELPQHLKQQPTGSARRERDRWQGDFVPRQLPPSSAPLHLPSEWEEPQETQAAEQPEEVDVTEQTYPTVEPEAPIEVPAADDTREPDPLPAPRLPQAEAPQAPVSAPAPVQLPPEPNPAPALPEAAPPPPPPQAVPLEQPGAGH